MESDLGASYHRSGLVGYGALNAAVELRVAPGQRQRQQDE
jgi:hypothetical protein